MSTLRKLERLSVDEYLEGETRADARHEPLTSICWS